MALTITSHNRGRMSNAAAGAVRIPAGRVRVALSAILTALVFSFLGLSAFAAEDPLVNSFQHLPALSYRSVPLWHLNGKLTTAEIEAQLTASRDRSGFGGVAVLPVKATSPSYLSDEYFARYGDILETCRKLGMQVVFYDDMDFPSGLAGGRWKDAFPDEYSYRLDNTEADVTGPLEWKGTLPARGVFMGAVAMNLATLERLDISGSFRDGAIAWQVPQGRWKLMMFTCAPMTRMVDYLNPASVDRFFSLTYDQYYQRFARYFGSVITTTYFDDVGVRHGNWRTWTPIFNDRYRAVRGSDPVLLYPSLWYDIGPDTSSARIALMSFRAELMAEGYPRKVKEWAKAHGIQSSGHAMGQYHAQPSFMAGDAIAFYRHSDIPMIDSIIYYGHGRPGFKLTSSASFTYDRPLTAVEIYGAYGWGNIDRTMLYRSGMELYARGANLIMPHGMWYDPAHVDIPPLISHFSDILGPELAKYNDWVGRTSLLLQGGRHVVDIGVLYPIASLQAYARLNLDDSKGGPKARHPGLCVPPESDLNPLSDFLTGGVRRDFTFLHPEILNERCRVDGDVLHLDNRVNAEAYRVVIIPGGNEIYWSNLQKIKAFYDKGGKVVATTCLPTKSAEFGRDREVREAIAHMFSPEPATRQGYSKKTNAAGGAAYVIPAMNDDGVALNAALQDAMPIPDVRFGDGTPAFKYVAQTGSGLPKGVKHAGMLSYLHKVKDGRNVYFFANSTDEHVDVEVVLRGSLNLQAWNPYDGTRTKLDCIEIDDHGTPCTKVRVALKPVRSMFFVESKKGE